MSKDTFLELVKEDQERDLLVAELQEKIRQDSWVKPKLLEYRNRLNEAQELFHEAVDNYPVEEKADMWTSRVRAWLEKMK
jgi:D-mannonate dehydratase